MMSKVFVGGFRSMGILMLVVFALSLMLTMSSSHAQGATPNVTGLTVSAAAAALAGAGLGIGVTTYECDNIVPEGSVIRQVPLAGVASDALGTVDIVVSQGECVCEGGLCIDWAAIFRGALALLALAAVVLIGILLGGNMDLISPINYFK